MRGGSVAVQATKDVGVLQDRIIPYAGKISVNDALQLATRARGIILSGRQGLRTLRRLRGLGYDGLALFDPAEYAREEPVSRPTLFDVPPDWTGAPKQAGATALFSYCLPIPVGHTAKLAQVLAHSARLDGDSDLPVLAVLALPQKWLRVPHLHALMRTLEKAAVPLAIALGNSTDPLGTQKDIAGFLEVLAASPVACGLIRTDIAALGALAHGAFFGGVGLSTSLRHFVPPGTQPGGNRQDKSLRLFVPRLLSFKTAEVLASAKDWDQSGTLRCYCDVCQGESLARFEDELLEPIARIHDVLAWQGVAERITSQRQELRKGVWRQLCHEAIEAHVRLQAESRVAFSVPGHLRAWERFSMVPA
jgi:hypothetical protein